VSRYSSSMKVTHVFMALAGTDHAEAVGWVRGIVATIAMEAEMRTAVVVDPDGNRIKFFEDPGG